MTTKSDKLKSMILKIQALKEKTVENGCSEAEALSAANLVSKLMLEYDITFSDIEFKAEEFLRHEVKTASKVRSNLYGLVAAIADFCDCEIFIRKMDVIYYVFFGSKKDVMIAEYICSILDIAINTELEKFKKTEMKKIQSVTGENGRTLSVSFRNGMVHRLSQRLKDMKREQEIEKEGLSEETGIALYNKKGIVKEKFEQLNVKLTKSHSKTITGSASGYVAGKKAADKVQINKAIS